MNLFLFLLAALQQNAVKKNGVCLYQPENNSTQPAPMFYRRSYAFNVTGREQVIGQVGAYSPWNAKLWFSLVGTDEITIDRRSGTLYAVTNLAPDQLKPHTFYAVATDSHYKSATVAVSLNLNSSGVPPADRPSFFTTSYNTEVSSSLSVNATVLRVYASGMSSGKVVYTVLNSPYFRVNWTSGFVYLTRPLGSTIHHNFTVTAAYQSTPQLRSFATVYVTVRNITTNSSALTLHNSGEIQVYNGIPRNGYVTAIRAVAKDPSQQSQIRYYLRESNTLRIDEYTGEVYVRMLPLMDRTTAYVSAVLGTVRVSTRLVVNKVCHPSVPVTSCFTDPCMSELQGPESDCPEMQGATCLPNYCGGCYAEFYSNGDLVTCSVKPTPMPSRVRPIFSSPYYSIRLETNKIFTGSQVGQVYASVPVGEDAIYSVGNTTYFTVDSVTGSIIVARQLNNITSHTFTVMASFRSAPQNMSVSYVHVEILASNVLTLSFPKSWYTVTVFSNVSRGSIVTTLRANASDMQSQVRYAIRGSSTIGINQFTGAVQVLSLPLSNGTRVNVIATLGNLSTSTILEIQTVCVPNVNFVFCKADPCQVSSPACPLPLNATCVANYCGGCYAEYFVNGSRVTCPALPSVRPVFSSPQYRIRLPSNQSINSVVGQVYASVPVGEDAIYSVGNTTYFTVDSVTGSIIVARQLNNITSHTFTVMASFRSAPQNMSVSYVHVEILTSNVLTLSFPKSWYTVTVFTNVSRGSIVTTLRANASDMQSQVRYAIRGSSSIGINEFTGAVYVLSLPLYNRTVVNVVATVGSLSTSTILEIFKVCGPLQSTVMCAVDPCAVPPSCSLPSNATCVANYCGDCRAEFFGNGDRLTCGSSTAPQVDPTIYQSRVFENSPIGQIIVDLYSLGVPFLPLPGPSLEFVIDSGGFGLFNISREGRITLTGSPDYESRQDYHLVVVAILSDLNSVSARRILITVHIDNVNDNAPEFKAVQSPFIVPSDLSVGDTVFRFWATDADVQDTITYQLLGGDSGIFSLNSRTGVVTLQTPIPERTYSLQVRATDSGVPSASAVTAVDIRSVSRSSGYPVFPYRFVEFRKLESSDVNSLIKTVPAAGGSRFSYQEVPGSDEHGLFRVEASTGNIYTDGPLDREGLPWASFVLEGVNLDSQLSSYVQVFLQVTDENDNAPVFPFLTYYAIVPRDGLKGSLVFTATANDADLQPPLVYSIVGGNTNNTFELINTRQVVLAKPLKDVPETKFNLRIMASDGRLAGTTSLEVVIQ